MSEGNGIILKSVGELLGLNFIIPSYQRGYRWDKEHVEDLLDDIWEFYNRSKDKEAGKFYCLQPIIVKKDKNDENNSSVYSVIDGQQRLTTIHIILSYLSGIIELLDLPYSSKKFSIKYNTREGSEIFLEEIKNISKENDENIDFYYMSKAYITIKNWFEENKGKLKVNKLNFTNTFIENTKVIWYEIFDNEIDVFTRINSGKIPLTDAELIKALFLNSKNFKDREEKDITQIEISKEWDEMEYSLQNDEFWYFLIKNDENSKNYSTRIELIFEIYANIDLKNNVSTYKFFENKKNDIVQEWSSIKRVFLTLKYWFETRDLYHLVGFLISIGKSKKEKSLKERLKITTIYSESTKITKMKFKNWLIDEIRDNIKKGLEYPSKDKNKMNKKYRELRDLEYGKDNDIIIKILLLFNIETLLNKKAYFRFAFDKFNKENWTLEHIHAQQDSSTMSDTEKNKWLDEVKKNIENILSDNIYENLDELKEIITEINNYNENEINNSISDGFNKLQNEISKPFGELEVHTIDNLALLSGKVNSSLSNNIFPIKRDNIISKDEKGEFIPICTKNVFLKYYTKGAKKLYSWTERDRNNYLDNINAVLREYLGENNE